MEADPGARIDRLERRIADLEAEVATLRRERPHEVAWSPPRTAGGPDPHWPAPVPIARSAARDAAPGRPGAPVHTELDAERLLRWGGVGLVVLAIAFAVSTAVSRGWIGPELQFAGALAVSLGLCGAGVWLRDRRPPWQHALCLAGVLGAHVTVASPLLRGLAPDAVAATATVGVAIAGLVLAVHLDSRWVAAAVAVAAPAGWYVSFGVDAPPLPTVLWMGVVVAAVAAVAVPRAWDGARVAALVVGSGFLLYPSSEAEGAAASIVAAGVGLAVAAAWCVLPSVGDAASGWRQLEIQLTMLLAPWCAVMVAVIGHLDDDLPGGLGALGAGAAVAGAAIVGRNRSWRRHLSDAHVVSLAVSASLALSIALGLLLGERTVALGFALQGAGLLLLERTLRGNLRILVNAIAVLALAVLLLAVRLVDAWTDDVAFGADLAHALALVAIGAAAVVGRRRNLRRAIVVVTLALVLAWLGSLLVHLPQGQAVVSVSWAAVGAAMLVVGAVRKIPEVAQGGLVVLGLTVAKLLTVDLNEVDTLWRAALFLAVGLAFLRLGFLLPKLTGRQEPRSDAVEE